jgi:hypothetical protein
VLLASSASTSTARLLRWRHHASPKYFNNVPVDIVNIPEDFVLQIFDKKNLFKLRNEWLNSSPTVPASILDEEIHMM